MKTVMTKPFSSETILFSAATTIAGIFIVKPIFISFTTCRKAQLNVVWTVVLLKINMRSLLITV